MISNRLIKVPAQGHLTETLLKHPVINNIFNHTHQLQLESLVRKSDNKFPAVDAKTNVVYDT